MSMLGLMIVKAVIIKRKSKSPLIHLRYEIVFIEGKQLPCFQSMGKPPVGVGRGL